MIFPNVKVDIYKKSQSHNVFYVSLKIILFIIPMGAAGYSCPIRICPT